MLCSFIFYERGIQFYLNSLLLLYLVMVPIAKSLCSATYSIQRLLFQFWNSNIHRRRVNSFVFQWSSVCCNPFLSSIFTTTTSDLLKTDIFAITKWTIFPLHRCSFLTFFIFSSDRKSNLFYLHRKERDVVTR